jgi:hypothetical protein
MKNVRRFNEEWSDGDDDDQKRYVPDGVWDLEDILVFEDEDEISEYPDYAIAAPYDTDVMIYLSRMPTKSVNYEDFGSSFEGHGTCAMIENCPKRILILGGND